MLTRGKLEALRKGLGPKVLARQVGISETYVSTILSGRVKPGRETLEKLGKILGLPAEKVQAPMEEDHD